MPKQPFSGPELCNHSAFEIVDLLKKGEVSPVEVLDAALERIGQVEPAVNAIPTLCEERARKELEKLQQKSIASRNHPGWLAGLPIVIKDLSNVAGVRTTYGSKGLAEFVPEESDPLVERLESRGSIVIGKTNTPEFGAGGNTFNDVFGRTRNPWDTRMNAAGSSGGAAVSLATGEMWLAHGSDHGGSLRTPAAYNGIVGLRPSPGIAASSSEAGYITEGQQGPMARSVRDCALLLDAMAGFQPAIASSYPAPATPYQQAVVEADGKVRIGFAPDLNGFSQVEPEIDSHLRAALALVEKAGGTVAESCPDLSKLEPTYHTLRGMMWATLFHRADENLTRHFKATLADNIAFGQALTMDEIAEANLNRTAIFKNMAEFFQNHDVLACPTVGNMPRPIEVEWVDEINGQKLNGYMDWLRFSFLATTTGLPAISVPVGLSADNMPIGLQLIGPPRGEAKLLAVAKAVEDAVGGPLGPIDPNITHF